MPLMRSRPLLDRPRLVRATREPAGQITLCDAGTGARLALHVHYSEPAWVQLLLQAEGRLEEELTEVIFLFTPTQDRARF